MAGNHLTVTFDAQMNVGQIISAINSMKKGLQGLKLPDNLDKKTADIFSKMSRELENFQNLSSKSIKNMGDFSKIEKSGQKIIELYNQLGRSINEVQGLSKANKIKLLPDNVLKDINAANNALKQYEQTLKKIEENTVKNQSALSQKENLLDKVKQYEEYAEKLKKASKDIEKAEEELNRRSKGGKVKKSGNEFEILKKDDLTKRISELKTAAQEYKKLMSEIDQGGKMPSSTTVQTSIIKLKEELTQLASQGGSALEKLFSELEKINGIKTDGLTHNLENAKKLINDLTNKETAKLGENLSKAFNNIKINGNAFKGLKEGISQTRREVEIMDERFRDISSLKYRIGYFLSMEAAVRLFRRALKSSFDTIKELDATMTETAVVTNYSIGDMWKQLPKYTNMANELGIVTNDAYKAATLYYQQGLNTNQVMAVSTETLKMARIAGIEAADATDYMTSALRGFNMEINETSAQRVNDVYSKLAASTASNVEELSIAMSKTASIASSANMEFENTAALLAQIIETTREAPETAGTAMKTIIARFSEVKTLFSKGQLMGSDEEGEEISINKIDAALKNVGISLKSFLRGEVGLDDILLELASKWDTLDLATQRYIATTAAGSRQQSRFLAMMSNYSRTQELVEKAYNAEGAGQEQFEKTLDSMETALNRLKNAWDQFAMGILNSDLAKGGITLLTGLITGINKLTDGLGGLGGAIAKIAVSLGAFRLGRGLFDILVTKARGEAVASTLTGRNLQNFRRFGVEFGSNIRTQFSQGIKDSTKKVSLRDAYMQATIGKDSYADEKFLRNQINRQRMQLDKNGKRLSKKQKADIRKQTRKDAKEIAKAYNKFGSVEARKVANDKGIKNIQFNQASIDKVSSQALALSVAAGLAGGALLKMGNALDEKGYEKSAVAIKTMGTALLGVGTVLSSFAMALPGLTTLFPELGTAIKAAGLTGLSGWLWVAGIAAAVAGFAYVGYKIHKSVKENSLEGQLEKTTKQIDRLKSEATEAKSAYDELLNTKQSYSEIQDTVNNLTKGTSDWTKSMLEANSQVIELTKRYPGLSRYLELGENGQLSITTEGWDYVEDAAFKAIRNSQVSLLAAQTKQSQLQLKASQKDINRQLGYFINDDIGKLAYFNIDWLDPFNVREKQQEQLDRVNELVSPENYGETFSSPDSKGVQELASLYRKTPEEIWEFRGEFAKYSAKIGQTQLEQLSYAKSMVAASASQNSLNYKYFDKLSEGVSKDLIGKTYEERLAEESKKFKNVKGEDFLNLAEELGITSLLTGNQRKDLETAYATAKNLDIETVREAKISKDQLAEGLAQVSIGDTISEGVDALTTAMKTLEPEVQQALASLISGNITDLTFDEIKNLNVSTLGKQLKSALGPEADSIMKDLGFDSMQSFINSWDKKTLAENYARNIKGTLDKIRKYSKNTKDEDLFTNFEAQQSRFKNMGLQYQSMVNNIFDSLEDISDPSVISAGWDAFSNAINDAFISAEQITEIQDWITGIDWSNPIEGAYALGEAANSSNEYIQEISNSMQEVGSSAFDASAQMKYFLKSDFDSIKEDLSDIINAGEEITGADIRGLAKNYKNLDKMLQNTGMSATSLGKALTMLNKGELKDFQLTNAVLSAIGRAGEIDDITASVLDRISNFDPGYNEGDITSFIGTTTDAISDLMSQGLAGSEQIGSYLDFWFGSDWDAGLETADQYIAKVNELNAALSANKTNMSPMWQNLLAGKDALGNAIDTSIFDDYGFSIENGQVVIGTDGSLEKMIKGLQEVGYTKNMAEAMIADEKARNPQFMLNLRNAEFPQAMESLIEEGNIFEGLYGSILDQSEIDAVLDFYGKNIGDFNKYLETSGKKVHILDLYDENGNIKDVNDALNQIGEALGYEDKSVNVFDNATKTWKKEGQDAGKQFSQGFIDENRKTGEKVLKLDDFNKTLKNLRIPDEAQEQLRKGFISSFENGAVDSIQYLSETTGRLETVEIPADFDWNADDALEQLEAIFAENDKELEIKIETDKLRESITGALEGLTIDFSVNDGKITMSINSAIDAADTEVDVEGNTKPLSNAVNNVKLPSKTVVLNFIQTGLSGILNMLRTISNTSWGATVRVGGTFAGGLRATKNTGKSLGSKAGNWVTNTVNYIRDGLAKGIKTAPSSRIALTGEEGPELHQLADGGYYITGTAGPSLDYVGKGDTIYTAEETKKILSGRRRSITRPRFATSNKKKKLGSAVGGAITSGVQEAKKGVVVIPVGQRSGTSGSSRSSSSNKNSNASASKTAANNTEKAANDAEKWENSFDHLYNLTQDINAELRTREKLEKQYNRYQKERIPLGKTLAQISKAELYNLEQQRKLQEKMFEARKHDIVATEEKYKDYTQYAHYNWQDQTIEIEWDKINAVTDEETGNKIEEYINKLEEIQDQIQEAEDALDDIYDEIAEIRERGAKANQELQDQVLDKLIEREQQQIDLQEKTNQAINDAANDLHEAISRNIEKMRQDRNNERKKEDLTEKERRLAYLKMDTTGGNALAIKQLEKELKEEREEFNDELVDQALNNMQEQNEEAAKQRERQVELLQGVLDFQTKIGYFAQRALEIVEAGTKDGFLVEDSELYSLLITNNEDYWKKSVASRNAYLSEIATLVAEKYAKDELVNSERNLNKGGYMTQMMNATSAEQFRQAEEARNAYINEHPEEGWATTGFSDSYQLGQINDIGYNEEQIYGKKDEEGYLIAGTGIDWQAKINEAIKNQNWEEAAMYEGYRDLKISKLKADDPARANAKMTYGSQAASAYAKATGSLTSSGERGTAKDQSASHGDSLLESKAKQLYEASVGNLPEPTTAGGYMTLMQEAMDRGRFDEAFAYAKKRDAKISETGKAYNEQDSFKYVYRRFAGYGNNWQTAWNEYNKGNKNYDPNIRDYQEKINEAIAKKDWKEAFKLAGQRDYKLAHDTSVSQYKGPRDDTTWEYVFRKWNGQFKTGGLVEGTGLAWLDGTPSRPEYVLNAGQTQAFLRLTDMIGNLGSSSNQQTVGDTYINVDINVDQIANDYDVEAAANKVKQIIYQDSMYRNVNRINLLR